MDEINSINDIYKQADEGKYFVAEGKEKGSWVPMGEHSRNFKDLCSILTFGWIDSAATACAKKTLKVLERGLLNEASYISSVTRMELLSRSLVVGGFYSATNELINKIADRYLNALEDKRAKIPPIPEHVREVTKTLRRDINKNISDSHKFITKINKILSENRTFQLPGFNDRLLPEYCEQNNITIPQSYWDFIEDFRNSDYHKSISFDPNQALDEPKKDLEPLRKSQSPRAWQKSFTVYSNLLLAFEAKNFMNLMDKNAALLRQAQELIEKNAQLPIESQQKLHSLMILVEPLKQTAKLFEEQEDNFMKALKIAEKNGLNIKLMD